MNANWQHAQSVDRALEKFVITEFTRNDDVLDTKPTRILNGCRERFLDVRFRLARMGQRNSSNNVDSRRPPCRRLARCARGRPLRQRASISSCAASRSP